MSIELCASLLKYRTNIAKIRTPDAAIRLQQYLYRTIEYWYYMRDILITTENLGR